MRSAWIEVDLGAYRRNLQALMAHVERPALAVVKANGYGHGLALTARAAGEAGCAGVAVALPEEGAELRAGGQEGRIVVLGLALEEQAELIVLHRLEPVVTRPEVLQALSRAAGGERRVPVHVKVDTGMTRVGIEPEGAPDFCRAVAESPGLRLAGVMTHFAGAEEEDLRSAQEQWSRFSPLVEDLRSRIPASERPVFHAANSAAALWFAPARLDWVRGGLLTYGVPPAPRRLPFPVDPVASLKARLVQVREVPAGRPVSYGGTWRTERPSRLALALLGYADGYPWALSGRGEALVRGRRVPLRGRVCMDQIVLDVTDLPPVEPGEEAVFLGRQGGEEITVQELADRAGTLSYEILTRLAARLPRVPVGAGP
jgi:alanine racemase